MVFGTWLYVNEYRVGFRLGFGDSDLECGKLCGKVGKEWGFAVGRDVEKWVGRAWTGYL